MQLRTPLTRVHEKDKPARMTASARPILSREIPYLAGWRLWIRFPDDRVPDSYARLLDSGERLLITTIS
jgi:hypothetical protein